jgi:hypothetical protein
MNAHKVIDVDASIAQDNIQRFFMLLQVFRVREYQYNHDYCPKEHADRECPFASLHKRISCRYSPDIPDE